MQLQYRIYDPTGNITALVESEVEVEARPEVAARVMALYPEVEQVGFVRPGELAMAGGEFCGNASMCAAVWTAEQRGLELPATFFLSVSGTAVPVEVLVECEGDVFATSIAMPACVGIEDVELAYGGMCGVVPVVRMEGISHVIVDKSSPLFALLRDATAAEEAVRTWCAKLGADGLGLMFVEGTGARRILTPLVYVPGGDTVFWEHSCASGSSAVGMYVRGDVELCQPGGVLRVEYDGAAGGVRLHGHVRSW